MTLPALKMSFWAVARFFCWSKGHQMACPTISSVPAAIANGPALRERSGAEVAADLRASVLPPRSVMIIPFLPVILGRYVQLTMLLDTTGRTVGGLQSS